MIELAKLKTRVAALFAALIIAAGGTWYLASPQWTLHQMKAAADANDPDALDSYIDYPALRQNLKVEIRSEMIAQAKQDKSGFGPLGLAIGTAMVGPLIDRLVTPAAIREALIAKRDQPLTITAPEAASALHLPNRPMIVRRGFSEFLVATKQQPNVGLLFKLHGLWWKLSGVELAPSN
jgi:hypothetical protein